MKKSCTKPSKANLYPLITSFLENRPLFYSFIRPQEAHLFSCHQQHIKSPILDFGCGDGFFADLIFPKNSIDIGLDVKESRYQEVPQNTKVYKKIVTYNGLKIPFKTNHFNAIFSNCVFEHLPHLSANLKELYRVLKPGGHLLTTVMTDLWEPHLLGGRLFGQTYLNSMRRRQVHFNLYPVSKWHQEFKQAKFKIVKDYGYLKKNSSRLNEITHYLALPSLVSYRLTGNWIPIKKWHQPFGLKHHIYQAIKNDITTSTTSSAAAFFVLQKPR